MTQVCALLAGGGYAEKVAVPAGPAPAGPEATSLIEAAALPETVCTVYSNVFLGARLARGETLLIHGGGSGIGTTAIQLAQARRRRSWRSPPARRRSWTPAGNSARTSLINYREEDFVERL